MLNNLSTPLEDFLDSAQTKLDNILFNMGGEETDSVFRPVRCLEADVDPEKGKPSVNGFVYFTIDTKKIYLGVTGGKYLMMGGSSGVYYGTRQLTDDEKYGDQVFFSFTPEEIDGGAIPAMDDLILNIPDGGFYRVLEVSNTDIQTQRLAISGGGGGNGSGNNNEGSLEIKFSSKTPQYSSTVTNVPYYIYFDISAKDSAGDTIREEGVATWKINGKQYTQKVKNGENYFQVDEYLDYTIDENKLVLVVSMNTGGSQNTVVSKTWYVKAINLKLEWPWTYSEQEYRSGETMQLKFLPYGNIDCKAHISFDGGFDEGKTYFVESISAAKTGREYTTNPIPCGGSAEDETNYIPYGSHTCDIWLTATVNGEPQTTEPIRREITVTRGGVSTILTVPFYTTVATQYDTVNIPFLVYDPDTDKCNVSFYVNDVRVAGDSYDRELQHWPYTLTEFGSVKLSIRSDNGDTFKDFELVVNKMEMDATEATGAAFSLKATNFSSNDQIKNWNSNGVTLSFSDNFDWKNGGLKFETMEDGSVEKYICVRQGTRMYINYKLFEKFTTGSAGGKNFKFCFKATNCYDYGAKVLSCYDAQSGVGIEFDAQKAAFMTPTYPNFATQYCENSYVEVETEIWPTVDDTIVGTDGKIYGDRFLMIWVDGVPAGVKPYSKSESLEQIKAQAKVIEIGSDLCDVYVYVAKAYERKLSEDEHLDNFIMDAPSANKMIDRYRRNDILDTRGEISYERLVAANPECRAYLYEMDHMTTSKDDKVDGCTYYELYGEHNTIANPLYHAEKARVYVQGTSSAAYGVAAFNLRTDFTKKGTIYDSEGNALPGWTVSDTAIPIDIACTKVNVASCENANNVVNAEWYNRFQPYHDAHRRKTREDGKLYRDTMEFRSGVVFIKDNNPETNYFSEENKPDTATYLNANCFLDTPGYAGNPYFKMYAIGNMGNDKKNVNVFHDESNPWSLCIEVADNQNPEHWMTTPVNMSQFDLEKPFHEFRYPDGNDEATTEQKQAWLDFVDWMSSSNPNGADATRILKATAATVDASNYKKNVYFVQDANGNYAKATGDFDSSKTYYTIRSAVAQEGDTTINVVFDNYTYKGFNPPGYENAPNPTEVSLKGTVETKYSTTKVVSQPKIGDDGQPELDDEGAYIMEERQEIVPYTHDTFDYRMAKMLSECEDHLVMDSVMFHYLYISRHTMVDNVAKNTFWSTEDGIHWDLTRNYDNDTSDGNDNSGNLSYTYGLEYGDLNSDGKDVFNASPSVWINFIHNLPAGQKALYKALENKGAWKASTYLAEFKKHQDIIPERCWIENYFHHYIRPRRLGLDEKTYLDRLEGGRKTHQRNQYETYQEFYLNSKYIAGTPFTDGAAIDLRLNKDPGDSWSADNVLPMTFYIDCYATIHLGGQLATSGRLKRGETFNAPVGRMVGAPNDATCYIYGAGMIQTISGLDRLYPGYAKLTGANKLRVIEFGSKAAGYKNERLKSLDIGSNGMLQKVQMWNCGNPVEFGALTLDGAYQLKELYLSGSQVKELTLADGATTEILELNPLTTLTMSNLTNLSTITMDSGAATSLKNMFISNCPEMDDHSYKWAKSDQLTRYYLTDFHWTISGGTPGYQLTDDFVLDNNGNVIKIRALENLNDDNTNPKVGATTATALTGRLTINVPCAINEYDIYNAYIKTYPNLIIDYKDVGNGYSPAAVITFMKAAGSTEEHYRVLSSGREDGATLATLVSVAGPTGVAMTTPSKEPTASQTFTFTGYWLDQNGKKYYLPADLKGATPEAGAIDMTNFIPRSSLTFYPDYRTEPRKYAVKFYDWTGAIIPQPKEVITTEMLPDPDTGELKETQVTNIEYVNEWMVEYGTTYDGPMTNFHYRPATGLKDNLRWAFQGWSQNKYGDTEVRNPEYVDLNTMIVKNTVLLYGHYLTEDCNKVASKLEYFIVNGGTLSLNPDYTNSIAGKITIPAYVNGVAIKTVSGFGGASGITHVYFQEGSVVDTIAAYGFSAINQEVYNLEAVYLPDTVRTLGESAFDSQINMRTITLNDNITTIDRRALCSYALLPMTYSINELPAKLTTLGMSAFQNGGSGLIVTRIPEGVTLIDSYAFFACPNVKVSEFGGNVNTIKRNAFNDAGNGGMGGEVTEIYIKRSVSSIGIDAFAGYASNTLTDVYFEKSLDQYDTSLTEMGIDPTRVNVVDSFVG